MRKINLLFAALSLFSTSCVSLLSQITDESAWNDYFKTIQVDAFIEDRLPASKPDQEIKTGVRILRQALGSLPFRDILISCSSAECFQARLVLSFDEVFIRIKSEGISVKTDDYRSEQVKFLDRYSYEKVNSWVESFHKVLFSGMELRSGQRALELSSRCLESQEQSEALPLNAFAPFDGGPTYLPRTFYSCLNREWTREMDLTLKETTERLGILIKKEESRNWVIQRQVEPVFQKTLASHFTRKFREEQVEFEKDWSRFLKSETEKGTATEQFNHWVPEFRKKFKFINVESLLTERISQLHDGFLD